MAAIARRSFFGFLFGAAAAVPALPKVVGAMAVTPKVPRVTGPAVLMPGHITYIAQERPWAQQVNGVLWISPMPGGVWLDDDDQD